MINHQQNCHSDACIISIECAVDIAQMCGSPPLKYEEFMDIVQVIWDESYEKNYPNSTLTF